MMTIAIVLGLGIGAYAQDYTSEVDYEEKGLFGLGKYIGADRSTDESLLGLPYQHGLDDDQDTPLGSGIAVLVSLGAAYALSQKRKEE